MSGKILVIPPEQNTADIYEVDQAGFLAVIATLQEHTPENGTQPATALQMEVNTEQLNIRSGPGLYYPDVGDLKQGDIVDVLEISGSDVWVRIGKGKWVACQIKTTKYLKHI